MDFYPPWELVDFQQINFNFCHMSSAKVLDNFSFDNFVTIVLQRKNMNYLNRIVLQRRNMNYLKRIVLQTKKENYLKTMDNYKFHCERYYYYMYEYLVSDSSSSIFVHYKVIFRKEQDSFIKVHQVRVDGFHERTGSLG